VPQSRPCHQTSPSKRKSSLHLVRTHALCADSGGQVTSAADYKRTQEFARPAKSLRQSSKVLSYFPLRSGLWSNLFGPTSRAVWRPGIGTRRPLRRSSLLRHSRNTLLVPVKGMMISRDGRGCGRPRSSSTIAGLYGWPSFVVVTEPKTLNPIVIGCDVIPVA
jgi:hypothetical protein